MVRRVLVALAVVALTLPLAQSSSAERANSSPSAEPAAVGTATWRWMWRGEPGRVRSPAPASPACATSGTVGHPPWSTWPACGTGSASTSRATGSGTRSAGAGMGVNSMVPVWCAGPRGTCTPVTSLHPSPVPNVVFTYGQAGDLPLVGDWNGDGIDSIGVRRGNTFYLRDSLSGGPANRVATFGRAPTSPSSATGMATAATRSGSFATRSGISPTPSAHRATSRPSGSGCPPIAPSQGLTLPPIVSVVRPTCTGHVSCVWI